MIHLLFGISLPDSWDRNPSQNSVGWTRTGKLFRHKFWEVQFMRGSWTTLIDFDFAITAQTDHAGVRLNMTMLGLYVGFTVYDSRHWDRDKNEWRTQ